MRIRTFCFFFYIEESRFSSFLFNIETTEKWIQCFLPECFDYTHRGVDGELPDLYIFLLKFYFMIIGFPYDSFCLLHYCYDSFCSLTNWNNPCDE